LFATFVSLVDDFGKHTQLHELHIKKMNRGRKNKTQSFKNTE
jgi:hypothetical protein